MQYRSFGKTGLRVSALGFGAMRFPCRTDGRVDDTAAVGMLRSAIDQGLSYVDTAYFYHDGHSEEVVGKALKDGYRDKTYVATKSPLSLLKSADDFDRCLEKQLRRLEIETIDFYLLHAVNRDYWRNIVLKFGLLEKMERARQAGKIRHIGFSFHDDWPTFRDVIDGYGGWEFCQIQLNYVDTDHQAGLQGLEYAASKGLGVVVMEPLLGGKLAAPPAAVAACLPPCRTPVEAALDFLWDRPEVSLILSGMSTPQQVDDNLAYADRSAPGMLTPEDRRRYPEAKRVYETMALVPCTGCSYCIPCPFGVQIPQVFEAYNRTVADADGARERYAMLEGRADLCRACGKCQRVCPQHILVSEQMKAAAAFFGERASG